jgi:hypothetical protein
MSTGGYVIAVQQDIPVVQEYQLLILNAPLLQLAHVLLNQKTAPLATARCVAHVQ